MGSRQGQPRGKPRAPCPCLTPPTDHDSRASPISSSCSPWAGKKQMPPAREDGCSGWWVWHTPYRHLVLKSTPTSSPHPSLGTASPSIPKHRQPPAAGSLCPKHPGNPCPAAAHGKQRVHVVAHGKRWEFGGAALQAATVSHSRIARASALLAFASTRPLPSSWCVSGKAPGPPSVQVNVLILQVV